jgi:hypothetical protein
VPWDENGFHFAESVHTLVSKSGCASLKTQGDSLNDILMGGLNAGLIQSVTPIDGLPSQSSNEQAQTEHACRVLFEEFMDLDNTLDRAS